MNSDMKVRRWLAILIVIVAVATGLRIKYAVGFMPIDDAEYARVAHEIAQRTFTFDGYPGPPVVPVRSGIVLPTAVAFKVFGPSERSMAAYPLLLAISLLLVVFWLTTAAFGSRAGLVAAALWAVLPMDVSMATSLRPDLPSLAYAFMGILVIYLTRRRTDADNRRLFLGGAVAGLAFGASWLCKESVIYFVPFCALLVCADVYRDWRRSVPLWAGVALGSIAVFVGEMAVYAMQTGDFLYRFHATELDYVKYPELFFAKGSRFGFADGSGYWKALVKRLFLAGPEMILFSPEFLYLPFFGVLAGLYGLYWRDRRFYFPVLLFASLFVMFNFASVSLHGYQPLPLFSRYFYPLCVPAVFLTGGLVATILDPSRLRREAGKSEGAFWGAIVTAMLILIAAYGTLRQVRDALPPWASAEHRLANVLRPTDQVYTDPLTRAGLEFYWKYPRTMNITDVHDMADNASLRCGAFVLINASYVEWLKVNHGTWLTMDGFRPPAFFTDLRPNWEKVWTNQNANLYRVRCQAPETEARLSQEGVSP